jgi:FAD/FMN-containing dehydrogenase
MKLSGWGNYPAIEGELFVFETEEHLKRLLAEKSPLIPFGNGRSYGDSALYERVIDCRGSDLMLGFDSDTGLLRCRAGILLDDIIRVFLPKGWFLSVTPGTRLITVGGAIAADVHGKNHHVKGCFSSCVKSFRLMTHEGAVMCSRAENRDLFLATCGGMGLTGVVTEAEIYLKKAGSSRIEQTMIKTANLSETFEAFEKYSDAPYSVAWIDCLGSGEKTGRCLLMTGDFAAAGSLAVKRKKAVTVPFNFPAFTLNSLSVKAFNSLYYSKAPSGVSKSAVDVNAFFYPLDSLNRWNRIYGSKGFVQYQFILPKSVSFDGLSEILREISSSGKGSFLAVMKLYGPENDNYLSFPVEGYSLALDFRVESGLFPLLNRLDKLVVKNGGRIYLAKDARMSREVFEAGYPQAEIFRDIRKKYGFGAKFRSLQSERLGL